MPNYNYRSNDYMRCSHYNRQAVTTPIRSEQERNSCTEVRTDPRTNDCCMHDLLNGMPIAMAYVPWQEWKNLYAAEKGFCRGTIFEDLDKPFLGIGGCCK